MFFSDERVQLFPLYSGLSFIDICYLQSSSLCGEYIGIGLTSKSLASFR